jgi:transposase
MAFIRKIKKGNSVYLVQVESYREDGKVKQRVIRYIGKEENGKAIIRVKADDVEIESVKEYLDYKVLDWVAREIGLKNLFDKYGKQILLMVYTQIVSRDSLYTLPEYVERTALKELLGIEKLIDKNLYCAMDYLEEMDFRDIERKIYERLKRLKEERKAFILDVTDTYFVGSQAKWKARRGKDNKYSKLVKIALGVTEREGFPILHKVYEGNISDIKIMEDIITESSLRAFEIILLDRGMVSYGGLKELLRLGHKVIAGIRMNKNLKSRYISQIEREKIFQPEHQIKLRNTKVYGYEFDVENGKLIVVYNPEIEITRRMKMMNDISNYNKEEAKYMGYSLIYNTTNLPKEEAVRKYYEKDIVEKAFKELKSSINLNPIRKYGLDHVKAHVKICYLAYAILSYIHSKVKPLNISAVDAVEALQSAYKVNLIDKSKNYKWSKIVTLTNQQKDILKALNCSV